MLGSLARLFWSRASLLLSRCQLRYSPSTQNEPHVVHNWSVVTKLLLVISSCRTLVIDMVRSVRIRGRPTHRHTLDISTLASRSVVWPLRSRRTPCSMSLSPTSTTIPYSSWLVDERSQSDEQMEPRSGLPISTEMNWNHKLTFKKRLRIKHIWYFVVAIVSYS
jgi:hypothetical protein